MIHIVYAQSPITLRSLCGAVTSLRSCYDISDSIPDCISCLATLADNNRIDIETISIQRVDPNMDDDIKELRARLFVEAKNSANDTVLGRMALIEAEHPEWSKEQVKEELYRWIQTRQGEMRLHIEKMRAEQQAELILGNEVLASLNAERREHLRRLDAQYRPSTISITTGKVVTKKALSKEEKGLQSIIDLVRLTKGITLTMNEAREYSKDPANYLEKRANGQAG